MAPGQEANSDNLGKSILMSTHNIQFHDKIRKKSTICFIEILEKICRD